MLSGESAYPLKVVYTGAVKDFSGYAEAARDYIRSLDSVNVDVSVDARSFEAQAKHLMEEVIERKMWSMMGKSRRDARFQIIHLTPDNYSDYTNIPRRKIGYYAWETSRLPTSWVNPVNMVCEEAWVPCQYLADVSVKSGVQVPVRVVPHAVPVPSLDWKPTCTINGLPKDRFKFYSIAQWSNRKNILGALEAYYKEFSIHDPVAFVLKTYRVGNARSEKDYIRTKISRLKRATKGIGCPPVFLIEDFLTAAEIQSIHYYCDCYISMSRSEAFGIPIFSGSSMGNPVIVPNYSAFPEYYSEDTAYLVDVPNEVRVENMRHISILYTGDMVWGNPSIDSCRARMREVFENRDRAKEKGLAAREYIKENLSYKAIGRIMKGHLETLSRGTNA